jgi:hypothetical protein
LPYKFAQRLAQEAKLRGRAEYREWLRKECLVGHLPENPALFYNSSWAEFLGVFDREEFVGGYRDTLRKNILRVGTEKLRKRKRGRGYWV